MTTRLAPDDLLFGLLTKLGENSHVFKTCERKMRGKGRRNKSGAHRERRKGKRVVERSNECIKSERRVMA
jgi:hypothetical protein